MPHRAGDQQHPHLQLTREDVSADRRKQPGRPGARPSRGGRSAFRKALGERLDTVVSQAEATAKVHGIKPHLVFRVPLAKGAHAEGIAAKLEQSAGLSVVSIEPDRGAIIAFREETDLKDFRSVLAKYEQGPRDGAKSSQWDLLEYIEPGGLLNLEPRDRIGPRLAERIGTEAERVVPSNRFVVEVELWHPGDKAGAGERLTELRTLVAAAKSQDEQVTDSFVGDSLALAKLKVSGTTLTRVLHAAIVAEVELPPQPVFDAQVARQATLQQFAPPIAPDPTSAARVCILDSGITSAHPLLAPHVGHAEAVLTAGGDASDQHGHGTMVGGIAVFGDVRAAYESGAFASPVLLFSARVLNNRNEFDDDKLIVNQIREAIETFRKPPHECRVFNLSLGDCDAALVRTKGRQTRWAEALDVLARELEVLLVVSAGNRAEVCTIRTAEAEQVVTGYPRYLCEPAAGLNDPATAAIAVTVGAIADRNTPSIASSATSNGDIVRALAGVREPAPFTRVGPGVNGAIKPEFVAVGGNLVFDGYGNNVRRIRSEPGTAVMSLGREPLRSLFAWNFGTSFAAPAIARAAAIVWAELTTQLGRSPHPNLVRAVLASSASVPTEAAECLGKLSEKRAVLRVCGYGVPDLELARRSADRRVTMIADEEITLDHFQIFPIPVPPEFVCAPGTKHVSVSLAFDPPVRARRADYLGVEMHFDVIRGKDLEEIVKAYKKVAADEEVGTITGASRIPLTPKATGAPGRKKSTLQKAAFELKRQPKKDYGETYYVVVRAERKPWLPPTVTMQRYALAVVLEADAPELYATVRQRLAQRQRAVLPATPRTRVRI